MKGIEMVNPANTAGPAGDGSNALAKESKAGNAVQWVITTGLTIIATGAANLDTSHWSGRLGAVGISVVGLIGGLVTSYLKKNR